MCPLPQRSGLSVNLKLAGSKGLTQTEKAVFALISTIYKLTGIRQMLGAIESRMAWYNWVLLGTVITAQLAALLASDGASFMPN